MAANIGSILGLQKALKIHTGDGDYSIDPSQDPTGYDNALLRSRDERVRQQRATEDAQPLPPGIDPAQNQFFKSFNRGQEDAAMGPAGSNRQWAGFLEAPNVLADNNPGMTYKYNYSTMGNPSGSIATVSPSVAALKQKTSPADVDTATFLRKLYAKDPASLAAAGYAPDTTKPPTAPAPVVKPVPRTQPLETPPPLSTAIANKNASPLGDDVDQETYLRKLMAGDPASLAAAGYGGQ